MALDINFYKQKLIEEKATLEKELRALLCEPITTNHASP